MPEFIHKSVMVAEVIEALRPRAGGRYVDGTLGGGGHAEAILRASAPSGFLYGCDRDGAAVEAARKRLAPFEGRFELRQENFARLSDWVERGSCNGVVLDLGVSSAQLDWPERGFSFQDGPLDMRMDQSRGATAADIVNGWSEAELSQLFWQLGDEPHSRRIARAIVLERQTHRIERTHHLARLVERIVPRAGKKKHPATRVFLALRLEVNNELGSLKSGLAAASTLLEGGGRIAILTFHSREDRLVKEFGREKARDYNVSGPVDLPEFRTPKTPEFKLVTRKALKPSQTELEHNVRARSAQLRVFEKV